MRKALMLVLLLLLSGLFLYACSGGGTTSSSNGSNSPNSGGGSQSGPLSAFTLNLVDSGNNINAAAGMAITGIVSLGTPSTATDVRVVIRKYDTVTGTTLVCQYDPDTGDLIPDSCVPQTVTNTVEVYKDIQDVKYTGGGSVSAGLPQGTGYTIDVITSLASSGTHTILKYGQATNVIVDPSHTSATITMQRVGDVINMTVPDSVISRGKYNVTLNSTLPFAPVYTINAIFSNGIDTASTSTVTTSAQTCSFIAPTAYNPGKIDFHVMFDINKAFLLPNEVPASWKRSFPISVFGEESYSTLVTLISVSVPVN